MQQAFSFASLRMQEQQQCALSFNACACLRLTRHAIRTCMRFRGSAPLCVRSGVIETLILRLLFCKAATWRVRHHAGCPHSQLSPEAVALLMLMDHQCLCVFIRWFWHSYIDSKCLGWSDQRLPLRCPAFMQNVHKLLPSVLTYSDNPYRSSARAAR